MRGGERSEGRMFENTLSTEIGSSRTWKNCSALSEVIVLNLKNRMRL